MQIPLCFYVAMSDMHNFSLATIGVCVFYASASVGAFFILEEKKMKKTLSIILSILMVISVMPLYSITTFADV